MGLGVALEILNKLASNYVIINTMNPKRSSSPIDTLLHKWLRIPYALNVRNLRRVKGVDQTILFIHGLGATGKMWDPVIKQLPAEVNVVNVDLLGFGKSPNPYWETYDAKRQARSLLATFLKLRLLGSVTIVGHSLGSLVAIEFAKRYPALTKSLVLCSPPIYRNAEENSGISREKLLRMSYEKLLESPNLLMKLYNFGKATRIDPSLELNEGNMEMFAASMRSSIINQTAIEDVYKLKMPVHLVHGALDPVVIKSNLIRVAKAKPNITLKTVAASHPLNDAYIKAILTELSRTD